MLVQDAADPDAGADDAINEGERVLEDDQFPCALNLAGTADLREALELEGVAPNFRNHPVRTNLTARGVERKYEMFREGIHTGHLDALDPTSPHCSTTVADAFKWHEIGVNT